jgi:hypothetical protein
VIFFRRPGWLHWPAKADGAGECEIGQEAASALRDRHVNLPIPNG